MVDMSKSFFISHSTFIIHQGMLEPTKDSVPSVCSPRHTVVTAQAPPGPPDIPDPSSESMQVFEIDWVYYNCIMLQHKTPEDNT